MAFGGSVSANTKPHTHNQTLVDDGGDLSETLTDMNGVALYSLITDNSAAVATNTADIATNTADIATNTAAIAAIAAIPAGVILMWSGSVVSIPAGWDICDGTNGTINLSNKFVRSGTSIGTTGGADTVTLTGAQSGTSAHDHSASSNTTGAHTHSGGVTTPGEYGTHATKVTTSANTGSAGNHSHVITVNNSSEAAASSSHENMPAYYELAYIQKS